MAMTAAGIPTDGRGNRLSSMGEVLPLSDDEKKRWSSVSDMDKNGAYLAGLGLGETQSQMQTQAQRPAYTAQQQLPVQVDEEERLDDRLALARRNSIDHATLKRASYVSFLFLLECNSTDHQCDRPAQRCLLGSYRSASSPLPIAGMSRNKDHLHASFYQTRHRHLSLASLKIAK